MHEKNNMNFLHIIFLEYYKYRMQNSNALTIHPLVLIGGALTFIAGLAWNDAFKNLIDHYYPENSNSAVFAKFTYAIIITIIIIVIGFVIYIANIEIAKIKKVIVGYELALNKK